MMVLTLTAPALGVLGRHIPSAGIKVNVSPFRFQELTNSTKRAQGYPGSALDTTIDWANT